MTGPASTRLVTRSQGIESSRIVVDNVKLDADGYVAVYADGAGAPGNRIGQSKLLAAGEHRDVAVQVPKSTSNAKQVWVMLHHEDNSNDLLDYPAADQPVPADNGVMAVAVPVLPDSK